MVTDAGSVQEMNVFEPSQWYGDSGGEVVELVTAITKSNIDSLSITHVWSRTENEAPADQIDINKIYYRVTFFKNGEQSILRDDFRYYYPCNDPSHLNPDGTYDQNEKYDFTIGEYEAGIVSCLCKLNPNYDDPTIPLNYCPF